MNWPVGCILSCAALSLVVASNATLAFLRPSTEGKPDDPRQITGCTVVRWNRESTTFPKIFVRSPGRYCLDRDYTAELRGCMHGCRGAFIDIRANDVEIDLRGHTLTMTGPGYTGVFAVGNNITIRNGRIRGPGSGVRFQAAPPETLPPKTHSPGPYDIAYDELARVSVYGPGGGRLENLIVETDQGPIAAAGANVTVVGNTVRAAVSEDKLLARRDPALRRQFIATSPSAMISVYGPGAIVEGNVIEQRNRTGGRATAYSILLRDAQGAIVRNNRVQNSGSTRNTVAVGLKDSTDVVLEGNTLVNVQTPVASIGTGSTFVQKP